MWVGREEVVETISAQCSLNIERCFFLSDNSCRDKLSVGRERRIKNKRKRRTSFLRNLEVTRMVFRLGISIET